MAFIFQAERKGPIDLTKAINPGPGQYVSHQAYKGNKGYAPFLSTVERDTSKKQKETIPGPGAYEILAVENSLKVTKPFHAMLNPEKEGPEINAYSTPFKSKTKRFEYKIETEQPGPGTYTSESAFAKAASTNSLQSKSYTGFPIQKLTKENRTVIPSIPSYMHSYGYSEADPKKLVLNKNPLIEIQQFVGPGYYDTKDAFQGEVAQKGTTWHKSKVRRFDSSDSKLPTKNVGPGSYEVLKMDGALPLYKEKESSGFASRTGRSEIGNTKPKSIQNKMAKSSTNVNFELNPGNTGNAIIERYNEEEQYNEESAPGPGYYHSEALASSLKMNYKPTKLQFFGSGSERFKDDSSSQQLGPGEYNVPEEMFKNKNKPKVGFQSTEQRIKGMDPSELGPGVYELKTNIVDRVYDKAKRGYLGSFGSTELRFKPKKIPEETPEQIEYYQREYESANAANDISNLKKKSHYFASTTNRTVGNLKKAEAPCPGSYEINHFDMAKKITENDSAFYTNKKVPFSSTETRFKWSNKNEAKGNRNGDDSQDDHSAWKRNITIKADVPNKPSSVFSSKTLRAASCMPRNGLPGPGAYSSGKQQSGWIKKTFNIKFLED